MKCLVWVALAFYFMPASGAVICQEDNAICDLYFDKNGSLVDRNIGYVIENNIGNGMFSDVSVHKYGSQYVIVQENHSSDRLVTAIPLTLKNNNWIADSIYYFSVSLMASSVSAGPLWLGRKIPSENLKISDEILDRAGDLAVKHKFNSLLSSGWPQTELYVGTGTHEPKGERCFAPFGYRDSAFPVDLIACRPVKLPMNDGRYEFSGIIDKKILIEFVLSKNDESIVGEYRYLEHPDRFIKIEGTLAQDGVFSMKEFGGKGGAISGYFQGVIVDGKFSGEWASPDKSRHLPLSMYMQGFPQ